MTILVTICPNALRIMCVFPVTFNFLTIEFISSMLKVAKLLFLEMRRGEGREG
jgi:hypothetical protein